jgi:hypothetical protein
MPPAYAWQVRVCALAAANRVHGRRTGTAPAFGRPISDRSVCQGQSPPTPYQARCRSLPLRSRTTSITPRRYQDFLSTIFAFVPTCSWPICHRRRSCFLSGMRLHSKAMAFPRTAAKLLRPWSLGVISIASVARAEKELRIGIHGRRCHKRHFQASWRLTFDGLTSAGWDRIIPSGVKWYRECDSRHHERRGGGDNDHPIESRFTQALRCHSLLRIRKGTVYTIFVFDACL